MVLGSDFITLTKVLERNDSRTPYRGKVYNKVILYKIAEYVKKKLNLNKCYATLRGHQAWINSLAIIPNSYGRHTIASVSMDTTLKLWHEKQGGEWEEEVSLEGCSSKGRLIRMA